MVGTIAGRLARRRLPGFSAIRAAEEVFAPHKGRAHVDDPLGARVEDHEDDAGAAGRRRLAHGRDRWRLADVGEAVDPGPGRAAVGAGPQPGVARAEVEPRAVVGIHRHPLAVAAAILVAAELER